MAHLATQSSKRDLAVLLFSYKKLSHVHMDKRAGLIGKPLLGKCEIP